MTRDERISRDTLRYAGEAAVFLIALKKMPATAAVRMHTDPQIFREYEPLIEKESSKINRVLVEKYGLAALKEFGNDRLAQTFRDGFWLGAQAAIDSGLAKRRRPWRR